MDNKHQTFRELGIPASLEKGVRSLGCQEPYPIQKEAIPVILQGKDLLGIARTGSGKTVSFALPILSMVQKTQALGNRHIRVLVLVPTRELAVQVHEVFKGLARSCRRKVMISSVYGGVSVNPQMMGLQHTEILIATPGRLLQLVSSHAVHFSEVQTLILDEADKLLNKAFRKEVDQILSLLPKKRQNLLFSATLSREVSSLQQVLLKEPVIIEIEAEEADIELIRQRAYLVEAAKKGPLLRHLIREEQMRQVLVFTSSIAKADRVAEKLRKNGIETRAIHRKKSQGARTDALSRFKSGKLPVLVATDLIARGIDIEFLPYVINYELPRSPKMFIHRIGRTGREQRYGEAISFITEKDDHHFSVIEKKMGCKVDRIRTDQLDLSRV